MPTYILLPNLIVEHSALSMGVGGNLTVTPNKDMINTSKNDTDKSTDMADDSIYIIISYAAQDPQSNSGPQVNVLSLLSNVSVNTNSDNHFMPIFHPDYEPYEDNIPDSELIYKI